MIRAEDDIQGDIKIRDYSGRKIVKVSQTEIQKKM